MAPDEEQARLTGSSLRRPGFLGKLLAAVAGAVLLVSAFMVSLLVFAVALAGALLLVGYVWWKTRDLRRQMRERPPGGHVIEGEVIRDDGPDGAPRR
jgi:Flp pilus assembly protein TadB